MAGRNCTQCNNYARHWGRSAPEGFVLIAQSDDCLGNQYGICQAGHNDVMKNWWDSNKDVFTDQTSDVDCYEGTELDNLLDNINNSLTNLIKQGGQ